MLFDVTHILYMAISVALTAVALGLAALALLFVGLACYELRLPKAERWYSILKEKIEKRKSSVKKENE